MARTLFSSTWKPMAKRMVCFYSTAMEWVCQQFKKTPLLLSVLRNVVNILDVDISPAPAATFRSIGGILDFFVFTGPSPDDVISQYTRLVGTSYLPPYWSLGFHLCRYGIHNSTTMRELIHRNREINIPYVTKN